MIKLKAQNKKQEIINKFWGPALEAVSDAISLTGREGKILICNKAMVEFVGRPYEEIIGSYCSKLLDQIPHPSNVCPRELAKTSKKREIRTVKIGSRAWINCIVEPLLDEKNEVVGLIHMITDITPLKSVEEKYKNLLENAPGGLVITNKSGVITDCNKAALRYVGYSRDEIVGKHFMKIAFPNKKDALKYLKLFISFVRGKGGVPTEVKLKHKSGKIIFVEATQNRIIQDGKTVGVQTTLMDVTERKILMDKIRESEERYRTIFENTGTATVMLEEDTTISLANSVFEKLSGYSRGDVENKKRWTEFVVKEDLERMKKYHYDRRAKPGAAPANYEFRFIDRFGNIKDIFITISMIPGTKKSIASLLDITDRKKAEMMILTEREKIKEYLDVAGVMIIIVDADGKVSLINKKGCEILEYPQKEIIGKDYFCNFVPARIKDKTKILFEKVISGEEKYPKHYENPVLTKNGNEKIISWNNKVLKDKEGKIVATLSSGENITDRKKAEDDLKISYKKLQKTLNNVINTLAHIVELRDPYTSGHQKRVAMLAAAISEELGLDNDKIKAINTAALIHDIGKINIPASVLARPGKISQIEYNMIKIHSQTGYDLIKKIEFPWPIADIVLQHHERLDGSGYPKGLKDKDICTEAKILAVADVVEAMFSHRPYRPSLGMDKALIEIKKGKGRLYDPKVVKACVKLITKKKFKF